MPSNEQYTGIKAFYKEAASNFLEWSPDPKRKGLYIMHTGYQNWQEPVASPLSAVQMSHKIIELSGIKSKQRILDAGCGVGSFTFEILEAVPETKVYGIDLSDNHIHLAIQSEKSEPLSSPTFSIQDYERTAFQDGSFDKLIYCESLIHSQDKNRLICEANRILSSKGTITIADIFMHTKELTQEEISIIEGLKTDMCIPGITHIQELIILLLSNGFSNINPRNITKNVVAPEIYYYPFNKQELIEEDPSQKIKILLFGLQKLLREGKAGYYILTAQKD